MALRYRTILLSSALILLAVGLCAYGLCINSMKVLPQQKGEAVITYEPAIIREVTFGGIARDQQGALRKTYSGKAPSFCPT